MAGYTRQSIASIINGEDITAPPLTAEFNQLADAFNGSTGHSHDGSTGNAPKIDLTTSITGYLPAVHGGTGGKNNFAATTNPLATNDAGDGYAPGSLWENTTTGRVFICVGNTSNAAVWRELVTIFTNNKIEPIAHDTVDLGTPSVRFQDLYLSGGIAASGNVAIGGTLNITGATSLSSLTASGTTTLNGDTDIGNANTDTVTITAKIDSDLIPSGLRDLGSTTDQWQNLYIDGTATVDTLTVDESATIAANLTVSGTTNIPTANITGGSIDGTPVGSTTTSSGAFTTLSSSGLATLNSVNIDGGAIDGTTIGASSHTTGKFTTLQSTGLATLNSVNIDGGAIDGTTIGATSTSSGAFTTLSASGGITGNLTGNVVGNVTGNVTGNLTGDVTGDLTGNVTASSGTSTFNNVTINGNLDMDATSTATITNLSTPVNSGDAASKGYVDTSITNLIDGAPDALNTLNELAAALADDANAYTTLDNKINTKLSKAGDTMTGNLSMGSNKVTSSATPSATSDLTNKSYVDTQRDTRLPLSGGTMSGGITMGGNKITATYTPSANSDLTTKTYVDGILGSATAASTSATAAATSATNAATSESNAATSAAAASASETAAGTSETNAASSASSAATSASNAATSETNAGTSETNASSSASAASNSATAASNSASAASSSASAASASESAAATSETNAAASAVAAAQSETNLNLGPIASTIADTAVDIFVYDTRKDSDGGAWRKRTQHTSWYNETLNTATRGSRKEFPAVAVIVAEATKVTIYDGDDPSLPMWMVFQENGTTLYTFWYSGRNASCVSALNGNMFIGSNGDTWGALRQASFVKDELSRIGDSGLFGYTPVSKRNIAFALPLVSSATSIINPTVNDVAMTVLPNAPIDAATGLPVPTIAVATDGGVSVIKDDGTVVDSSIGTSSPKVVFADQSLVFCATSQPFNWVIVDNVGTLADGFTIDEALRREDTTDEYPQGPQATSSGSRQEYLGDNVFATSNTTSPSRGVFLYQRGEAVSTYKNKGMIAKVQPTYNTGWMPGDIKGAFLADTDDTDLVGGELVTNGDFATSSDWTTGSYWSIGSGVATKNAAGGGTISQTLPLTSGALYVMSVDVTSYTSGDIQLYVDGTYYNVSDSTGTKTATFNAPDGSVVIGVYGNSGSAFSVDNISVRLAEEDRSVNGNGLQVFGTVTKSAVSSGADLVAYSGFSASNYLEQPYNSDLDFGTGDFCIMGWVKGATSMSTATILSRVNAGTEGLHLYKNTTSATPYAILKLGSSNLPFTTPIYGNWAHVVAVRQSGTIYLYTNGSLDVSYSGYTTNVSPTAMTTEIGWSQDQNMVSSLAGIALVRISATAPSPEQIKKIYEDEKVLFQDGAQATLYGSSDAVTALAYDDSTELLHVGTSAGRSVFQGLRRVDNTTTAVGAAISASNNLVAEE